MVVHQEECVLFVAVFSGFLALYGAQCVWGVMLAVLHKGFPVAEVVVSDVIACLDSAVITVYTIRALHLVGG